MTAKRLTKSNRLQEKLLKVIRRQVGKDDQPFSSVRQIAKEHRVSTITAGKVISNLISQGFLAKREGIGTFVVPNHSAEPKEKKDRVALCLGETTFSFAFFEFFSTLIMQARRMEINLSVFGGATLTEKESLRGRIENALNEGCRTLLVGPIQRPTVESVKDLLLTAENIVLFGNEEDDGFDSVGADTFKAGYLAGKYFGSMGHRDILVMITHLPLRVQGFIQGLRETGVELAPHLIIPGDGSERSGYELVNYALRAGFSFTGIMTGAPESTIGTLFALQGARLRIPEDVSVISFGDEGPMRSISPVTSISLRDEEIAGKALAMIAEKLEGKRTPRGHYPVEPLLIDRNSVKALL